MLTKDLTAKKKLRLVNGNGAASAEEVALLGHGIKSPLTRIVTLSELLLKELPGELNDQQKEYMQDIFNNSHLLLNSVNSLLSITKSEAGFLKLNIGPYNLREIVESVVVRVDSVAISKGTEIIIDIPDALPIVYCDRYKIEQVLYNLLDNAMKFTEEGTITVSARETRDKMISVTVSDTGIGIKEKNKSRVFEKFFTEKNSVNPGGSGLGLAVVKEYVNLHNGKVCLKSRVGKGTSVTFAIPNKAPEEKELTPHASSCR